MEDKKHYVVGFVLDHGIVILVKKGKPPRWAGRYTGPGGKIEPNEEPHQAMRREFREETGMDIPEAAWTLVCRLDCNDFTLDFFKADWPKGMPCRQMESEEILLFSVDNLPPAIFENARMALAIARETRLAYPVILKYRPDAPPV